MTSQLDSVKRPHWKKNLICFPNHPLAAQLTGYIIIYIIIYYWLSSLLAGVRPGVRPAVFRPQDSAHRFPPSDSRPEQVSAPHISAHRIPHTLQISF
jgi:hypothetical protein